MATSIDTLVPGEWYQIPNSRLDQAGVFPSPAAPSLNGVGVAAVMEAWGGGAFDLTRNRFFFNGGGHGDYGGNEIYAFSLITNTWSRIWGPSANAAVQTEVDQYADGNPTSVHSYCGLLYLPGHDKYFRTCGSRYGGSGGGTNGTWYWNPITSTWTRKTNCPQNHVTIMSAYDPVTDRVYLTGDKAGFYEYNPNTDTFISRASIGGIPVGDMEMGCAIDPDNRLFVCAGNGGFFAINLNTWAVTEPASTGGTNIISKRGPALEWDPVSRRIVCWYGGATTYSLNTSTWVFTANSPAGANTVTPPTELNQRILGGFPHSKWRYWPAKNVFLLVNTISSSVYAYRLTTNPYPNRTWVSKPSPTSGNGPYPGGAGKHGRLTYDSRRGSLVFTGGDYQDSVFSDNGNARIWTRDVFNIPANNSWTTRHPFCSASGQVMPSQPDNVGFCYDPSRDRYYTIPGFFNPTTNVQPNCPNSTLSALPVQFNPVTGLYASVAWTQNHPNGYGGDTGATFAVYDPISDRIFRFRNQNNMESLDMATGIWSILASFTFGDIATPDIHSDQTVIDVQGRAVYCYLRTTSSGSGYLLKYSITGNNFTRFAVPTVISNGLATTGQTDIETWMAFDPISRKILLPAYHAVSYTGQVVSLGIFDVDTQIWETETPNIAGMNVNTIGFDPAAGVMIAFGRSSGSSNQFYYRYGGTAAAPQTAPDPPVLSSPANTATGIALNPTLSWNASPGATSYQLQVSTVSNFSSTIFDQSGLVGTSQALSNLLGSTAYYWRVRASNAIGTGNYSSIFSFTTLSAIPLAPTNLRRI